MGFWSNLFNRLLAIFKRIVNEAFTVAQQMLIAEFKDFVEDTLKDVATNTDWSDEKKRKEALKLIKEEALARGKELSDSFINRMIELIYGALKNRGEV